MWFPYFDLEAAGQLSLKPIAFPSRVVVIQVRCVPALEQQQSGRAIRRENVSCASSMVTQTSARAGAGVHTMKAPTRDAMERAVMNRTYATEMPP
jgi:phosphatidate phosphatase APP1